MAVKLPVQIDRASPVPLYHQLAEQLAAAIDTGTLSPGDAFENELALAERLGLSRPTVRRAIGELVTQGLLVRRRGVGTTVAKQMVHRRAERLGLSRPTVRRAIGELVTQGLLVRRRGVGTTVAKQMVHRRAELTSLYEDLAREGRHPRTEVLSLDTDAQDERATTMLGLPPHTPLVAMVRVRYAGDTPLAVLRNWLPPQFADLTREQLQAEGLYALLRARGVRPAVARQTIGARNARGEDRRLLRLTKAEPLLTMTRSAYDAEGEAVEFGDHCYRAEHYALDVTVHER